MPLLPIVPHLHHAPPSQALPDADLNGLFTKIGQA